MEYELYKDFTLLDLYKAVLPKGQYKKVYAKILKEYEEEDQDRRWFIISFKSIEQYPTMMKYLPWLCELGFVIKVDTDIVLIEGMQLINTQLPTELYRVHRVNDRMCIFVNNNYVYSLRIKMNTFKIGMTLSELNKIKTANFTLG
jgi:hypothetical protein